MKKVLIVTYYWPPSGGPGVQRVLKFVKYLPEFGWEPIILTVQDGEYPAIDESLLSEVPENCKVYKTGTVEFFTLFKKLSGRKKDEKIETYILNKDKVSMKDRVFRWIRQNVFVPDARIGWYFTGYKKGLEIIENEKPDLIFSSSPPHSLQLLAKRLAHKSGLPWVADFRDPWTQAFWDKDAGRTILAKRLNQNLETSVLDKVTACTTVSKGVAEIFAPASDKNFRILPNGYDPDDFKDIQEKPFDNFKITYAGHIAASQNPKELWDSLAKFPIEIRKKIQIDLFGSVDSEVQKSIAANGLTNMVTYHGYIPHEKIVEEISNTDVLLLLIPQKHGKGILTGKLFEYLATGNYILGIGDPKSEASAILTETKSGEMYSYDTNLVDVIMSLYNNKASNRKSRIPGDEIEKYSRKSLTSELAQLFDQICN